MNLTKPNRRFRHTALFLAALMGLFGMAPQGLADFVPSSIVEGAAERQQDLQQIQQVLENKLVRTRLSDLGYAPDEIETRLDRMSDRDVHQLASSLDDLQAGGDALGAVVAVLLIVLLVVLILKLADREIIVT